MGEALSSDEGLLEIRHEQVEGRVAELQQVEDWPYADMDALNRRLYKDLVRQVSVSRNIFNV